MGSGNKKNKEKKRRTRQARAGLEISVSRCHKAIASKWRGKVSSEAGVILAAFLQYVDTQIITSAAASASKMTTPNGEKARHRHRITGSDVQVARTENTWLRRDLVKGRVIGTAPPKKSVD